MAADREKEESLLPPDYVSLAQLQKKWLQAQEEKKMKLKQKQEEEDRDKIAIAPIGDPRLSEYGNDRKEVTPAGRRGNAPRVGLVVVKASDEIGKGEDITADVNRKTKSEQEGQRSKLVGKGNEVNGNEEKGVSRMFTNEKRVTIESVIDVSPMKAEKGRIAAANRGGNERRRDIRGSRQEYRMKIDESLSKKKLESEHCERRGSDGKPGNRKPKKGIKAVNLEAKEVDTEVRLDESEPKKTLESEHGERRGNGGKPRNGKLKKGVRAVNVEAKEMDRAVKLDESESKKIGVNSSSEVQSEHGGRRGNGGKRQKRKPKKGSKAVNLEVKEVDVDMGDEVVAVCNAIYCLTTSDENGISEPKGCQVNRTEGNKVGVKCLAGDNVALEKDRPAEVKGVTKHDERGRVESDNFLTFTAGDVDKHPELTNENYHGKLRVGNERNRYPGPKGNMRSRWGAHASFGRFESRGNRKEGNSRLVWMKKGEKAIAAEKESSGVLADQD